MSIIERSRIAVAATFLSLALPAFGVLAQGSSQDLEDFIHYTNIAKPELAREHLKQLLDSGISDTDLANMIREADKGRLEEALTRARRRPELRDIVALLETRTREGEFSLARNHDRIAEAIQMLGSSRLREQDLGRDRLREAGEYAVPALLREITDGKDATLRLRCVDVIWRDVGRRAVMPLCEALTGLDAQNQARVCQMLGQIGYPTAAPYLAALAEDSSAADASREAATRSLQRVDRSSGDLSTRFASLGRNYLVAGDDMISYPTEATNIIWRFDRSIGLAGTAVPTSIYSELMAMRLARRALQYNGGNANALVTFIAANLKRDNELPEGETDPMFGDSTYTPDFYAMAAGPSLAQDVLALALDMENTPLIRDAIRALSRTTGGANMFPAGGRKPLIEALMYPDRRVRYDAALAVGNALPKTGFAESFQVVPLLASAVRAGDATYAVVLADDPEEQKTFGDMLGQLGYEVVATAGSVDEAASQIARAAGIDLVLTRLGAMGTRDAVQNLRNMSKTSVAPIVVLMDEVDLMAAQHDLGADRRNVIRAQVVDNTALESIVNEAMVYASGGKMSEADAMAYSFESIAALHEIAISNSPVFDIRDAESALADALSVRTGGIRLKIADVLASIDTESAQRAIFDAALGASGNEQIELLKRAADSAKSHGDHAEPRHINRLLDLIKKGGEVGQAAARVHGALNLSADNVVRIIAD